MKYWAIVEIQNGMFNCVYAPYTSLEDANKHRDKLLAYRKANPNAIQYEFKITLTYRPDFVG